MVETALFVPTDPCPMIEDASFPAWTLAATIVSAILLAIWAYCTS